MRISTRSHIAFAAFTLGAMHSACVFLPPGTSVDGLAALSGEAPLVLSPAPTERTETPLGQDGPLAVGLEESWQGGTRDADLIHLSLSVVLDLEAGRIVGTAGNTFRALRDGTDCIRLHANGLEIREVQGGDGGALGFRERGDVLDVTLDAPLAVGDEASISVEFASKPTLGYHSTLTEGTDFAPSAYGTAFPAGLRHWMPTWDQPGDLATIDTKIQLRDDMSAVANGALIAVEAVPGDGLTQKVFSWSSLTEIPVRSMAIAAAQFDTFAAEAGETEIYFHLPKGTDPDVAQSAFGESSAVIEYFSRIVGLDFPFPRYDQAVLPGLASFMLDGASLTLIDADEFLGMSDALDDRRERPRRTVARGAARKWFGAWLAPLDERHRWLLDGLALTLELDYEARVRGLPEVSLEWDTLRESVARRSKERLAAGDSDGEVLTLAREEAAERAAWVLRIIRHRLGEETFWGLVREFLQRDGGRLVTVEDFRRDALKLTGIDLGPEIAQWTTRVTVPELKVRYQRRTVEGVGESLGVVVEQVQAGPLFRLALPVEVHFASGLMKSETLILDQASNLLIVPMDERVVDVAIDPQGTVLARFDVEKDEASWIAQGSLARSAIDRAHALVHLDELSSENSDARTALIRILRESPEPTLRERTAQALGFEGRECNMALEGAATEDASPLVRRAALQRLLQRFAQGAWKPDDDGVERLLMLHQREQSPAVREMLDRIIKTVPQTD